MDADRLTFDAYWTLVQRIPTNQDPMLEKAQQGARDAEYAEHVRKFVGITNGRRL